MCSNGVGHHTLVYAALVLLGILGTRKLTMYRWCALEPTHITSSKVITTTNYTEFLYIKDYACNLMLGIQWIHMT